MGKNNFNNLIIVTTFIIGLIILLLSYFEKGTISLIYQLISLVILTVSVILLFFENIKIVKKTLIKKNEPKAEDMYNKNLVSIELDESDYTDLNDDEQKLMNMLNKNEGSMEQRDITKKAFKDNKVKAHRIISSLEEKKLILKRKDGKTNKIFLK